MTRHGNERPFFTLVALLSLTASIAHAQTTPPEGAPPESASPESAPSEAPAEETAAAAAPETRAPLATGAAPAFDLDFVGGLQLTDVSGSREKFEEFGTANEGFVLDQLRLRATGRDPANRIELEVQNAMQDDESYRVTVRRQDRYRLSFEYAGMPHRFARGVFPWGGFGTGRLQLPDVVQAQLEANEQTGCERSGLADPCTVVGATDPNADTSGEDAIQQGIIRGLYSAADRRTVALERNRVGAGLEVNLSPTANAWVRVRNENRDGTRPLSTGSYERWPVGSGLTHTADRFLVLGAELAEPLDNRTFGVDAGAGVHGEAWLADVEYTFTQFRNFEDVLLWDNPFRINDAAQVAGGFNRSRFAVGQLVLVPDSLSHDLTATGAIDLPLHGRLSASASYGIITQDDAFFPYTRNSAIIATDLAGTAAGPASAAALPARDLNGDVRTIAGTLSASIRPIAPVAVSAKYRVYRYDNRSSEVTFPGYAAFGESAWRREKNDVTPGLDAPVANEVFDYTRHDADLGVDVRLTRILSVSADVAAEWWRFDHLRLDKLDEYGAGAGFALKPTRRTSFSARYRYSDRASEGYLQGSTAENPEARGLLNYNWSDRTRHLADARAQYAPSSLVTLGLLGRLVVDEHGGETEGGTAIDRFRFGRTDARSWIGSADVAITPSDRLSFQVTYSLEQRHEGMAAAAKDDAPKATDDFGIPDNFAPENYWRSQIDERVHSIGLTTSVQVIPDRVVVDAGYNLSLSDLDVDTNNPNGIQGSTLANATANDWPAIENRVHEVFGDVAYALSPMVRAGVRYLWESYDLDDFAWDIMEPYMAGRSAENSTRFLFADATYNAYEAHVATVYIGGSF